MHRSRDKNSQLPARKREQNSATPMAWYSRQFQRRVAVSSQSTAIYEKYSHQTTLLHSLNGLFSRTTWVSRHQKGKTGLARDDGDLECSGSSWTICKQPAPRNHTNTSSLNFYRPDALPDAQPTVSSTEGKTAHEIHEVTSMRQRTFLGIFSVSRQTRQCSNEC